MNDMNKNDCIRQVDVDGELSCIDNGPYILKHGDEVVGNIPCGENCPRYEEGELPEITFGLVWGDHTETFSVLDCETGESILVSEETYPIGEGDHYEIED